MRLLIPETAGIRRYFVGKDNLSVITAKFDLEIHQVDSQAVKIALHHFIDAESILLDRLNLFLCGKL